VATCGEVDKSTFLDHILELFAISFTHGHLLLADRYPIFIDTGDLISMNDIGAMHP